MINSALKLQETMLDMEQSDIPTTHRFADGVYAREIQIPAGVCVSGAKHKTEFFMVLSKGSCVIIDGSHSLELEAPSTTISRVGAKRLIFAVTDTIITTFHPTTERDVLKIEDAIIESEGLKIANNSQELLI